MIEKGWNWLQDLARANREHLTLDGELERMQLRAQRVRAERDEDELTREVRQLLRDRRHDDLRHQVVQPVDRRYLVPATPNEQAPEQRAVDERRHAEGREDDQVRVQRQRVVPCPGCREHVVRGDQEHEPEGALDVDEHLVPEPDEQGEDDRNGHGGEREHAGEDGPARGRAEQVERGAPGDRRPAREDEDDVPEQEHEGDLAGHPMRPVHAVESVEERLDESQPRAEHEVQRERRRAGESERDCDCSQARVRPTEGFVEPSTERPQDDRHHDQRAEQCWAAESGEHRRCSRCGREDGVAHLFRLF